MIGDREPTACDTDAAKQQLLATALAASATATTAAQLKPEDAPAEWAPGVFELAWAVRQALPAGLAPGDFDGVNVQIVLAESS